MRKRLSDCGTAQCLKSYTLRACACRSSSGCGSRISIPRLVVSAASAKAIKNESFRSERRPLAWWKSIFATPGPSCSAKRQAVRHRSEEHTSELQSLAYLVCRLLLEKKIRVAPEPPQCAHDFANTLWPRADVTMPD